MHGFGTGARKNLRGQLADPAVPGKWLLNRFVYRSRVLASETLYKGSSSLFLRMLVNKRIRSVGLGRRFGIPLVL